MDINDSSPEKLPGLNRGEEVANLQTKMAGIRRQGPVVIRDGMALRELERSLRALGVTKMPARETVVIDHPPHRSRYAHNISTTRVHGAKHAVEQFVSWLLLNDSVTQGYEHMALTLAELSVNGDVVTILLHKNNYAGD